MAQTWRKRPSEILGIEDEFIAYSMDRAVMHFGSWVERRLEEATKNSKTKEQAIASAERELDKILGNVIDHGGVKMSL